MNREPLRTTVVGSYPFPGWFEFAFRNIDAFGASDREELIDDAVTTVIQDQLSAGLDIITDGEQSRRDFNLSFYSLLEGIDTAPENMRRFGPPAHDQRGKYKIVGELSAPDGLKVAQDFERLKSLAPEGPTLKASIPGPYTLSGRLLPNKQYSDRYAITEALVQIVREELEKLVLSGCEEITVDEPSMSCYAYKEDTDKLVNIFNSTVEPVVGKTHLSVHLCFGNYKGRAVSPRRYAPMFPAFLEMSVDEIHVEMASREFSELDIIAEIAKKKDVAVGVIDVKSYFIEPAEEVSNRVRACLAYAPADRLSFAPDCGLSQAARWAAKQKLENMVAGVHAVRGEL